MLYRKHDFAHKNSASQQAGYGMVELMIVMSLTLVVSIAFYTFFKANFFSYLNLQTEASNVTELAAKSHRMGNVLRGLTDIDSASADEATIYAYFYPTDTYVSKVRYYKNGAGTALMADVTLMTSNPPHRHAGAGQYQDTRHYERVPANVRQEFV